MVEGLYEERTNIELVYCPYPEIQRKYKKLLDFKAKFLLKIMMLRYQGQTLDLAYKLNQWIEENLDQLF